MVIFLVMPHAYAMVDELEKAQEVPGPTCDTLSQASCFYFEACDAIDPDDETIERLEKGVTKKGTKRKIGKHKIQKSKKKWLVNTVQNMQLLCTICSKCLANQKNFDVHMSGHDGIKPYKCSKCFFASTKKSALSKHCNAKHTIIVENKL